MKALATSALIATSSVSIAHAAEPVELATFAALPAACTHDRASIRSYGVAIHRSVPAHWKRSTSSRDFIHGGCWSLTTGGREQLRHLGAELASEGIAVWSIGYRRANEDGGGYPGTFLDVGLAIDGLLPEAARLNLDVSRTILVGHSAGGHLALWAAARERLPAASRLYRPKPFIPRAVISMAGVGDLKAFARFVPLICGPGVIERLAPAAEVYAEISPAALPKPSARVVMFSGILDRLVPPYVARDYSRAMRRNQATSIELVDIPDTGHFDLVTPGTAGWEQVKLQIVTALSSPHE